MAEKTKWLLKSAHEEVEGAVKPMLSNARRRREQIIKMASYQLSAALQD